MADENSLPGYSSSDPFLEAAQHQVRVSSRVSPFNRNTCPNPRARVERALPGDTREEHAAGANPDEWSPRNCRHGPELGPNGRVRYAGARRIVAMGDPWRAFMATRNIYATSHTKADSKICKVFSAVTPTFVMASFEDHEWVKFLASLLLWGRCNGPSRAERGGTLVNWTLP
jgi:hypothetical protein